MRRRITDTEASMGTGALIIFIAMILLSSIVLATMILIAERLAQNPQKSGFDSLRSVSDKILINEMYVLDDFDNYGIIFQLSPGSKSHTADEMYWVLQCTDENGKFWNFGGDFTDLQSSASTFANESAVTGIMARYYEIESGATTMPDVSLQAPDFINQPTQINFAKVGGATTWTDVPFHENYASIYTGYINIPADDTYTFRMNSDDGSIMYLDGEKIIDNDGVHSMTEKSSGGIVLEAGYHSFQIEFFEASGDNGLILTWASNAIPVETIPATNFFRNIGDVNIATFEPGVVYEIDVDQNNQAGSVTECGPSHLFENGLEGSFRLLVGGGGYTHATFEVHNDQPGTRII